MAFFSHMGRRHFWAYAVLTARVKT